MRITGTAIKLGAFSLVLLLFTAVIVVVFGQMRFDRTTGYSAIFSNSSGLRAGQFVRASGVEVGKVKDVKLIEGGSKARVDFDVDRSLELFEDLTVRDNLFAAAERPKWHSFLRDIIQPGANERQYVTQVEWAMELLDLADHADALPADISHGQRKLVGVARALAARPRLVLLDEPAAGLDTAESQHLGQQMRGLLDEDISVFLIDHDMGLVLSVCDYIYVLDFGRIIASGTPTEVRNDPIVIQAYLGEEAGEAQARDAEAVRGLTRDGGSSDG